MATAEKSFGKSPGSRQQTHSLVSLTKGQGWSKPNFDLGPKTDRSNGLSVQTLYTGSTLKTVTPRPTV